METAKRGVSRSSGSELATASYGPAPMYAPSIRLTKFPPEDRNPCMRDGLCFRCRQRVHLAKECSNGRVS